MEDVRQSNPAAGYRDEEPPAELALHGNRLYDAGEYLAAEHIFQHLVAIDPNSSWSLFQLGRISARLGRWAEAIGRLDAALAADRPIVWAHFEKAMALEQLGLPAAEFIAELAQFARQAPEQMADAHYAVLMRIANAGFDAGCYEQAAILYDLLARRGRGGDFCILRQADLRVIGGKPLDALQILAKTEFGAEHAPWAVAVQARALLALACNAEAATMLKPLVAAAPKNPAFVGMLFTALERSNTRTELGNFDIYLSELGREHRLNWQFRARMLCEDYEGIARLYADCSVEERATYARSAADAMNRLIRKQDFAAVDRFFELVGAAECGSPAVVCSMLAALYTQRDWDRASQVLRQSSALLRATDDPELRLRQLEYFCYTVQLDEAKILVSQWLARGRLPDIAATAVAGLYAALGEWAEIIELFRDRVEGGSCIDNPVFFEALARAARKTGRYGEVLQLLATNLQCQPAPALAGFRDRLLVDMALRRSLGRVRDHALPIGEDIVDPAYADRAALLSRLVAGARTANSRPSVFFCADRTYLLGACVAVFSLLRNNIGLLDACSLLLACSDDQAEFAADILAAIGAAFSVEIAVLPAAALVPRNARFRTDWGLYSRGHVLSDSAYYRILMAQRLLEQGADRRALYLDSDVCVGPGLRELLETDLAGQPLAARAEPPLREITDAARKLGIDPEAYFNSGVLLFDLSHPLLPGALARAVEVALHRQEILTFHDQCALNLAFQNRTFLLEPRFNTFVRESSELKPAVREPVIWHYLDRPKPWDPMYAGANNTRWMQEFAMLGELLGPEFVARLLACQLEQTECGQVHEPAE